MRIVGMDHEVVCCPHCQSRNLRYSNRMRPQDFFYWFRRKHGLRCLDCKELFYARTDERANAVWVTER